jgi:hypothetical protein
MAVETVSICIVFIYRTNMAAPLNSERNDIDAFFVDASSKNIRLFGGHIEFSM